MYSGETKLATGQIKKYIPALINTSESIIRVPKQNVLTGFGVICN